MPHIDPNTLPKNADIEIVFAEPGILGAEERVEAKADYVGWGVDDMGFERLILDVTVNADVSATKRPILAKFQGAEWIVASRGEVMRERADSGAANYRQTIVVTERTPPALWD